MRISDWSSDVCSSDLREADHAAVAGQHHKRQRDGAEDQRIAADLVGEEIGGEARVGEEENAGEPGGRVDLRERAAADEEGALVPRSGGTVCALLRPGPRSGERRVGTACVSTCV